MGTILECFGMPDPRLMCAVATRGCLTDRAFAPDNLDVYRVVGRRPPGLELLRKRSRICFGPEIGGTSAPRARVSAVGAVRHTRYVITIARLATLRRLDY